MLLTVMSSKTWRNVRNYLFSETSSSFKRNKTASPQNSILFVVVQLRGRHFSSLNLGAGGSPPGITRGNNIP